MPYWKRMAAFDLVSDMEQAIADAMSAARAKALEEVIGVLGRIVIGEIKGLEKLKLTGADRDDWIVRAAAAKKMGFTPQDATTTLAYTREVEDLGNALCRLSRAREGR